MPKTEETIKVKASQIDGKMPSKVYVLENGTKLSDELILNKYNATQGSLEFTVNFVKDNKITWNNGKDEYTLIFIYESRNSRKYKYKTRNRNKYKSFWT